MVRHKRLQQRVNKTAPLPRPAPAPSAPPASPDESAELARDIGEAFGRMVQHYLQKYSLTVEEARERARTALTPEGRVDELLTSPPEELTWFDLGAVSHHDPEKALAKWEEIKRAARQEVRNGHRAARSLEVGSGSCWERATFLAVRAELLETLGGHSPLERLLIDQLAHQQSLLWRWQETVAFYTLLANDRARRALRERNPFEASHLQQSESESMEQAERMVERLHRLYLRTLKALQDQRRSPHVFVRQASQVNVAQQQVALFNNR
jgi:hypothetical protein